MPRQIRIRRSLVVKKKEKDPPQEADEALPARPASSEARISEARKLLIQIDLLLEQSGA